MIKVSASILASNFLNLEDEIRRIESSGADMIHVDVMDGNFVPNITFGVDLIKAIRRITQLKIDTHLMIEKPELLIGDFIDAGSDVLTFHYEATNHHERLLDQIKSLGKQAGIAINPSTNEAALEYLYKFIDIILVMTVNPGFAGQEFLDTQVNKIKNIKERITNHKHNCLISVDGGINMENVNILKRLGVDIVAVGSSFFKSVDYKAFVQELKYEG